MTSPRGVTNCIWNRYRKRRQLQTGSSAPFAFPQNPLDIVGVESTGALGDYPPIFAAIESYLRALGARGRRPNFESQLLARLNRAASTQDRIGKSRMNIRLGKIHAALPEEGIRDNTVNRMLLMSNSEHHRDSVPAAYFIEHVSTD